ncbi:MAG TPA: PKD domain-containing protein [Frankiaceae bacterium]|nr:PKD domain-containing protein [Frankiaceae bacterium]
MTRALVAVASVVAVAMAALPALPASAASPGVDDHGVVANVVPFKFTPNFANGAVKSVLQVTHGGTTRIFAGGTFTSVSQVTSAGTAAGKTRNYLLSFDPATGTLDTTFLPVVNGEVDAIVATPDGSGIYVAGRFSTAGGVTTKLALLNTTTGAVVTTFKASVNAAINDLALVGNHLLVGGNFTAIGGLVRDGLGSVNATTGAVDANYFAFQLTGHHAFGRFPNSINGPVGVQNLAVSPDGTRAIVDGNFINAADTVGSYARDQIVSINLTTPTATIDPNWNTNAYTNACFNGAYDGYMRDISWSPDGKYFVVTATGGYDAGSFEDCDSASRFENSASGLDVKPTWVDLTGTDSLYSVAVTTSAVYVGGHNRWLNNPYGQDSPGPGAVARPGLGALDPITGVPLSWNPGRNARGHGAEVVYATQSGIWVGSDTDSIGYNTYKHQKLAYFPFAGGKAATTDNTGVANSVFVAGTRPTASTSNVLYRVNAAGGAIQSSDSGPDWAGDTDSNPSPLHNPGSAVSLSGPVAHVAATVPAYVPKAIFSSERWDPGTNGDGGEMTWTFPVPASDNLTLNLFFANRYDGTSQVGQRQFDVTVDGQQVLSKYDIVADVGDQTATMKSFPVPSGSSTLTVSFSHETENPLVDGIEVVDSSQPAATPQALDTFSANTFDASTGAGGAAAVQPSGGGIPWGSVRGAFVLNGRIWYGMSDGNFYYRTWDGANAFGPAMLVDPYNDPYWDQFQTGSGQTYRGTATSFYDEIPNVTGMFYANRSIYYTLYGDSRLFRRDFSPDTAASSVATQVTGGVISPVENVVTDPSQGNVPDFSQATGMFVANGTLWFSRKDGNLYQATWSGSTVTSSDTLDANASGTNWSGRGLFVSPGGNAPPPPQQPVASFNSSCSNLACTFNGSASTAPGSSITSYAWTFGDGATATGATPNHTYLAGNTYTVSLTVTNAATATNTTSQQITVSTAPPPPPGSITYVGSATANGNATSESVTTPASVKAGNGLLLIATAANASTLTAPAGWTKVDTATSSAVTTTVWRKVATATDHGTAVKVGFPSVVHGTVQLLAYAGTNTTNPVVAYQKKITSGTATTYTSPTVTVPAGGDVVVSYWTAKSSAVTAWTAPGGQTTRSVANGSGGGHVNSLATDGGSAPAGAAGGLTATANTAGSAFTAWTIVLG